MQRTLIIELPEDVFEPLAKTADQAGKTPEEIAARWLATAAHKSSADPLERFIDSVKSTVPDWADRHDSYLGDNLVQEARGDWSEEG